MEIHLYTFVHNEEKILPFFFKHYEKFVTKFFVYDNGSTDNTLKILKSRPDVVVRRFNTKGKQNNLILTKLKNKVWKDSDANWVIVCDADEFLHFRGDAIKYFVKMDMEGYSICKPYGHEMLSENFPKNDVTKEIRNGVVAPLMSKVVLFKPYKISAMNYQHGAHNCFPEGNVHLFRSKNIKLLHYKQISLNHYMERINRSRKRVPKKLLKMGLSTHYFKDDKLIKKNFLIGLKNSKKVI